MCLKVRRATIDDAPALAQAHIRAWKAACESFIPAKAVAEFCASRPQRWQEKLSREDHTTRAVLLNGRIVGHFNFGFCLDESLDDSYYQLYTIYIDPDTQRQGIGRKLMIYAEEQARANGKRAMVLKVFAKNESARRFYESCGYHRDGRGKIYNSYGRRLRVLRYIKEL